jgi:PAS domain S-box-containing protein
MTADVLTALGLALGSAVYLLLAWYVWNRRSAAGARGLLVVLLAVFVWTTCYGVELRSRTVGGAQLWGAAKFVGIVTLAPGLWSFVGEYTGRSRRLSRRTFALLGVEPAVVLALLFLPATTGLIRDYSRFDAAATALPTAPIPDAGLLFWPHALYTYALLVAALGLLVARLARISRPYRWQAGVVIVASALPLLFNIAYNAGLLGSGAPDPTPFLFAVLAGVLVWGFFRLRLLDLVPVARGIVMEQMVDGVLVLDAYSRVVDANPAGAALLGVRRSEVVGRYAADVMPALATILEEHRAGDAAALDLALAARGGAPARDLAVSLQSLADRSGAQTGRLLLLRDVTERTAAQRRLRELLDEQTQLADTLQASLRPASLPDVPGLYLAARSVPGGRGSRVSGDFYDVHPATDGEWAFVLGDVAGKGVRAAVVTSMARYTVRTLSAQGCRPAELLRRLNAALLDSEDGERFCTVVYGRLARRPLGVEVCVALGGHPPPLLRRADGTVEAIGVPGTALGLVRRVDVQECVVHLAAGDVLLGYTDGVTEARRGVDLFGDERLAAVLAGAASGLTGRPDAPAAALLADAVAGRVLDAVTAFAGDRDDVALLVLAAS